MDRLRHRLRYEEIAEGYGAKRVVTGYEVALPCGTRGVGETMAEAIAAAEHARGTHLARVERLRREAGRLWCEASDGEIPF